jgi:membrane associated rhomboid family serine protease
MPFLPIHDDNERRFISTPYVTWGTILACVLVYVWQNSLTPYEEQRIVYALATIPAAVLGEARLAPDLALVPPAATLVTSLFLHGDAMHLIGNMVYLYIFGDNVEDSLGHGRFAAFYLLCGIAASLAHALVDPASVVPLIGASGAIGGVLGAYLLLHPRARITVLLPFFVPVRISALLLIGGWFAMQIVGSALSPGSDGGGIAFWAHIGGFLAGMALLPLLKRRRVPLFGR